METGSWVLTVPALVKILCPVKAQRFNHEWGLGQRQYQCVPQIWESLQIFVLHSICKFCIWLWRVEGNGIGINLFWGILSSVQSLSHVRLFVTPWTAAHHSSLSITNSRTPPKPMSIESVMPSNHLILCRPLLLLPSIFPSIRVCSNESALRIRWPKYWSFSFNISPSNEHPGLISFRMHWLDLLAVQGTLKSLLQHHSSKSSILLCSDFFIVQLSHPYMSTGKTIALTRWIFVGKVMSLFLICCLGTGSLVVCYLRGLTESDKTEMT